MKSKKTLMSVAIAAAIAIPSVASANTLVTDWQLGNTSSNNLNTMINQLNFNGESYVVNTLLGTGLNGANVSSTDTGVFNVTTFNNGTLLKTNGGQYTFTFNATDFGNLTAGTFIFTGGQLNVYYNSSPTYSTTSANSYGAATGIKIGSFAVADTGNYLTSGGEINADGTPKANGQITVSTTSTMLNSNYWHYQNNANIPLAMTLGFVTTNASEDPSANKGSYTIDQNLVTALGAPAGQKNVSPTNFFISNGGQFKLETVPEPGTIALLGIGILGLGLGYSKRRVS